MDAISGRTGRAMAGEDHAADKLREYLRALTPQARALLLSELEKGALHSNSVPQAELLLRELRALLEGGEGELPDRIGAPAQLFFAPLQPYLVDDAPDFVHPGRISRDCVAPIWDWICTDVVPAEAKAYAEEVARALDANDAPRAEQAARAFQDRAVARIDALVSAARNDSRGMRQIAARIGTPRSQSDLHDVLTILKSREGLASIAARIPSRIRNLNDDQVESIYNILDGVLARQRDLFSFALILVMNRLPGFWQLIRIACRAAETDLAERVAETSYAAAVTIVLAEIDRQVRTLRDDLRRGQSAAVTNRLKDIHEAVRGVRADLDLSATSAWGKQVASIRARTADALKSELETLPGRVRRLLRHVPSKDIARGATIDASEVEEVEGLIGLLSTCRTCASELALNELTQRVSSDLQTYLERGTQSLLEGLRAAPDSDRPYLRAQVDAAVRFCGRIFGQEYATLLARAAEVAVQSDRDAAQA
jgi:hypothetical protein